MTKHRTAEQLDSGAHAVSYRSFQLANAVFAITRLDCLETGDLSETLTNALIDSTLVNARGLAWFFQNKSGDVHVDAYLPGWKDSGLALVLEPTIAATSMHLAHATWGSPEGELHPGAWPLVELAATYVDALSRFVRALSPDQQAIWTPDPREVWNGLERAGVRSARSPVSDNPRVKALTVALQRYLDADAAGLRAQAGQPDDRSRAATAQE